jgi:hypothetical protein
LCDIASHEQQKTNCEKTDPRAKEGAQRSTFDSQPGILRTIGRGRRNGDRFQQIRIVHHRNGFALKVLAPDTRSVHRTEMEFNI